MIIKILSGVFFTKTAIKFILNTSYFVLPKRLELLRLTTLDPKSSAATNYAKGAGSGPTWT
jgi:hypothetical protein